MGASPCGTAGRKVLAPLDRPIRNHSLDGEQMALTLRVMNGDDARPYFSVTLPRAGKAVKSTPYQSICKLEEAVRRLMHLSTSGSEVRTIYGDGTTVVRGESLRHSVRLQGDVSREDAMELLDGIANADVVDQRPSGRRRTDLTGPACSL